MEFGSYQMVANNTASLNTASYLNRTEHSLFVSGFTSDLWYGFSTRDAIELSIWDRNQNFISWSVLNQTKSFNEITLSYLNALNFPSTYSYSELLPDFILYKNAKILVNPTEQTSASFGILDGSYYLDYNFVREMAGTVANPLIIKDISPSRKELKLIPLGIADAAYNAFCQNKILLRDISPLYLETTKACPYGQIYSKISPLYKPEINTIKSVFFLNTDGEMVNFLRTLYEDVYVYLNSSPQSNFNESLLGSSARVQGIKTYFTNYLLSNSDTIVNFSDIDNSFNVFVSASIERKFSPIGKNPSIEYVNAKVFVYDFFTRYFYQPASDVLSQTYNEKYNATFKNALNFGNARLLSILEHGVMDERVAIDDPLTLLVKLQTELPNDISIQEKCWVSNVSLVPYVVNAILKNSSIAKTHTIGVPNFSAPMPNVSLTNTNKAYTATDLRNNEESTRELVVSRNLTELNVDYTNFHNFVVFSSAELRHKIFKNKIINLTSFSASLQTLEGSNVVFLAASGSNYPFYTQEYENLQGQLNNIVNSFDGYESYLYRSGKYTYDASYGAFVSASYVVEMDDSASYYDTNNRDSLINNCPEHILTNSDNDDYIIFLSMIGHFFDEIYVYIANMPSEKTIGHNSTEEFTRRVVDYMLETFGWKIDDSLEQATLLNNYLTSEQLEGLNSMSSEERLKSVRNRILLNLPQIFKTKGTEESVKLLMACYGIPSSLLSVREYGGVNHTDDKAAYTTFERSYMYQWNTSSIHDHFRTPLPSGPKTYLFKLCIDNSAQYTYNNEQALLGGVLSANLTASLLNSAGSGEWAIGFVRIPKKNGGKMFFRIGSRDNENFKMYTQEFPLFDGEVYSVMLRRNDPDPLFEFDPNINVVPTKYDLYVQRNESGTQVLKATGSKICYESASNYQFNGQAMNLVFGGWFADYNGQGFTGAADKLQVWFDPILDSNFEDYVNSINAYSFSGSRPAHQSLLFRMHTDYPFDMQNGIWPNANPFYAISSSTKQEKYLAGIVTSSMDFMSNWGAWSGSTEMVYNTSSCQYESQSAYPFQFKVIDYPSTWGISNYGPNKFRNEKIRHISQSIEARFDDKERSTYVSNRNVAPDSNQIGFFVDPQDFRNKDIIRYFGNYDFMDAIGNPTNQFSSSYTALHNFRQQYATSNNEYSGSRTLFNELITLYKLYFNRSIFEAIKNLVPARTNALVGILIEPTVLERPKYMAKPVFSETNTGSVFYADITASHYFRDPNTKLVRITESLEYGEFNFVTEVLMTGSNFDASTLPNNLTLDVNVSYINLPSIWHPINYLPDGSYVSDMPDDYQLGHYGSLYIAPITLPLPPVLPVPPFSPGDQTPSPVVTPDTPVTPVTPVTPPVKPPPIPGCLLPGTSILMADKTTKNVEDITLGDMLASRNGTSVKVVRLWPGRYDSYYIINNRLRITYEHPVMVMINGVEKMVPVEELNLEDYMVHYDDSLEAIISIEIVNEETPSYNFIVDGSHLYVADEILVHNIGVGGTGTGDFTSPINKR